jgi:HSP20 family protein
LCIELSELPMASGGAKADRFIGNKLPGKQQVNMSTITKWNPFKAPSSWDPFREMEEMQNRLLTLFGRRWPALRVQPDEEFALMEWLPPVDIEEDNREYIVKAELPGMKKEEVKLKVEGGTLTISGERKAEKEEKDKKYHRLERSYGTFQRSFTLPEGTQPEKISAEFKDGVLLVHLPKDEKAKPKAIEVTVN